MVCVLIKGSFCCFDETQVLDPLAVFASLQLSWTWWYEGLLSKQGSLAIQRAWLAMALWRVPPLTVRNILDAWPSFLQLFLRTSSDSCKGQGLVVKFVLLVCSPPTRLDKVDFLLDMRYELRQYCAGLTRGVLQRTDTNLS